ncbi:MAG: DNA adenine methylase [Tenericutes bacterium]|nr:DNA adenine methylase [Mycoplasmatota bacterium]
MYKIYNRRYTGSKTKLIDWIFEIINKNCNGKSFVDIFSGTGVVSYYASKNGYEDITLNDLLYSSVVIYNAFFGSEEIDILKLEKIIVELEDLSKLAKPNYFSKNFGGKYFEEENARRIGYIRQSIQLQKNINNREKDVLIASLVYSMDKLANTVGHYDAFFKNMKNTRQFEYKMIDIENFDSKFNIFREDANKLIKNISGDILYIDPPYNSRQYNRFYHVIENLVEWKKPKLFGTALKPKDNSNSSEYCKVKAPEVFANLIENSNFKYIVVSYNNTYNSKSKSSKNKITLEQIEETLNKKGSTKIYTKNHPHFNAGNTDFDNHMELLFVTKVGEKFEDN